MIIKVRILKKIKKNIMNKQEIYKCEYCEYKTNRKNNLKRHQLAIHKLLNENNNLIDNNEIDNNQIIQYVYLLREREFIKTNEDIYKIGKTKQENLKRLSNYPNGTQLIYQTSCYNCDIFEKIIIEKLKLYFQHMKEIGNEYFKGNFNEMIYVIIINQLNYDYKNKIDKNIITNEIYNKDELIKNELIIDNGFKCNKCSKFLSSKQNLNNHLKICKGILNPLECHLCHKILSNSSSKSKHLKRCKDKTIMN